MRFKVNKQFCEKKFLPISVTFIYEKALGLCNFKTNNGWVEKLENSIILF